MYTATGLNISPCLAIVLQPTNNFGYSVIRLFYYSEFKKASQF